LGRIIGDATGKSVSSALIMSASRSVFRMLSEEELSIGEKMKQANQRSKKDIKSGMFVADSILSRGEISPELKSVLIESAFKKGLAGWIRQHRKIGLVHDRKNDDRWLTFPDQPYNASSALALPIISGKMQLAILTLMHSMPDHFTQEIVELMKITANQIALVLDNALMIVISSCWGALPANSFTLYFFFASLFWKLNINFVCDSRCGILHFESNVR
jgi:GAF domain-containing protein